MRKTILVILAVIVLIGIIFLLNANKANDQSSENQSLPIAVDTSNWKTYRNEEIGIEFRYPYSDSESPVLSDAQILDQNIDEDIYIKAYKLGTIGLDSQYYRNLFSQLDSYKHGEECNQLNAAIPIYGPKALNNTCKVFIADSGVKILTGFYGNPHGGPPLVSFFITKNYEILLMLFYDDELINSGDRSFNNQQELVRRIESGKFPDIIAKIEKMKSVLKTIRLTAE